MIRKLPTRKKSSKPAAVETSQPEAPRPSKYQMINEFNIFCSVGWVHNQDAVQCGVAPTAKKYKSPADVEADFAKIPFHAVPSAGVFLVHSKGQPFHAIAIEQTNVGDFYKKFVHGVRQAACGETSQDRHPIYKAASWYGKASVSDRQQLRLSSLYASKEDRQVIHQLAYGGRSFELEKAFNVTGLENVDVDSVSHFLKAHLGEKFDPLGALGVKIDEAWSKDTKDQLSRLCGVAVAFELIGAYEL